MAHVFVDSNIIIYAFSEDPKREMAASILRKGCETSVQGLNEFVNVARRKQKRDWQEIEQLIAAIRLLCKTIHPIDIEVHEHAVGLSQRYAFSIFDALMIASALRAKCTTFYSEDMQHGMLVAGNLQILNPFKTNL